MTGQHPTSPRWFTPGALVVEIATWRAWVRRCVPVLAREFADGCRVCGAPVDVGHAAWSSVGGAHVWCADLEVISRGRI